MFKFIQKIVSKQQAFKLFENRRREYLELARWQAKKICEEYGTATIDDVREQLKYAIPGYLDKRFLGGVFHRKYFILVDHIPTRTKTSHQRLIGIYRLREAGE